MNLKPLADRLVVEPSEQEEVTAGGEQQRLLIAQALLMQGRNEEALTQLAALPADSKPDARVALIARRALGLPKNF